MLLFRKLSTSIFSWLIVPMGSRTGSGIQVILAHVCLPSHGPRSFSFHLVTPPLGDLVSPLFVGISLATLGGKVAGSELPTPLLHHARPRTERVSRQRVVFFFFSPMPWAEKGQGYIESAALYPCHLTGDRVLWRYGSDLVSLGGEGFSGEGFSTQA